MASIGSADHLYGTSEFESGQVDLWMTFMRTKTTMLAQTLANAVFGNLPIPLEPSEYEFIMKELKENIKILNK